MTAAKAAAGKVARRGPQCFTSTLRRAGRALATRGNSSARLRLLARGRERHGRRERLGIDLEVQDRGLAGFLRGLERRKEIRGLLHRLAVAAERAGIGRKIRVLQAR